MKNKLLILFIAVLFGKPVFAQTDVINTFFKQYENNDKFTLISISPKMFKMVSKIKWEDAPPEVRETISKLTSFRLLSTEEDGIKYYNDAAKKLNLDSYEEIMTVRDDGENVRFFVKEASDIIHELVMLVGSKNEFVIMTLTGVIDLDNIGKLGNVVNIKGMDNLKNIKSKK